MKAFILVALVASACTNHKAIIVDQIRAKEKEAATAHMCAEFAVSQSSLHYKDPAQSELDFQEAHKQSLIQVEAERAIDSLNLELKKY
jgi:hypothetical protein